MAKNCEFLDVRATGMLPIRNKEKKHNCINCKIGNNEKRATTKTNAFVNQTFIEDTYQ